MSEKGKDHGALITVVAGAIIPIHAIPLDSLEGWVQPHRRGDIKVDLGPSPRG